MSRLDEKPCTVVGASSRVQVEPKRFVYPDLLVFCGKLQFNDGMTDTIANPKVIIEVLSPSTAAYDYTTKFAWYRKLPSLEEYVLVEQSGYRIDVFRRGDGGQWILTSFEGPDAVVRFESLGVGVPMADVYKKVLELPGFDRQTANQAARTPTPS